MANLVEPELTPELYEFLQRERFVILSTLDFESGGPYVSAISWVLAKDNKTIYCAIDNRSRAVKNIQENPKTVINVIAGESTYSISGDSKIIQERMEGIPLPLALIQLNVTAVKDVMFYGSKISAIPQYEKTYDLEAAKKLDKQVMDGMKNA
jgi:hypothetical protein